jgi:hypothetical protein
MAKMILRRTMPQSEFGAVEIEELDYSGKNDDELRGSLPILRIATGQLSGQPATRFDRLGFTSPFGRRRCWQRPHRSVVSFFVSRSIIRSKL